MIRLILILLIASTILPIRAYSLGCSARSTNVFYGNGMFNSWAQAEESRKSLKRRIFNSGLGLQNVELAYNVNERALEVLLQAAIQKKEEYGRVFWRYLSKLSLAPDDFIEFAKNTSREFDRERYLNDDDLKLHVAAYRKKINLGDRVLLVAHSQGNFYANAAWNILEENSQTADHITIVGVATPVSEIAGGGRYATLTQDLFMAFVRDTAGALPPNVTNSKSSPLGHEFVSEYLEGDESGPFLIDAIQRGLVPRNDFYDMTDFLVSEYIHPSLIPFWTYIGEIGDSSAHFTDAQCVAASAFSKVYDWWGESCNDRSLASVLSWMDKCQKSTWGTNRSTDLGCALLGDSFAIGSRRNSTIALKFVLKAHPECIWPELDEVRKRVTPEVILQAKALLQKPPTGTKTQ